MSLRETIRVDRRANVDAKGTLIVTLFRLAQAARGDGERPRRIGLPVVGFYKVVVGWFLGVDLPVTAQVGPGLKLQHAYGVVIHPRAVLGARCRLNQGVTIGVRGRHHDAPVLGDDVSVGSGAQILGPVTVGDEAAIGAGALVVKDVPAGWVAVNAAAEIRPR